MVNYDNQWYHEFLRLADNLGFKGSLVTKVKKYFELQNDGKNYTYHQIKSVDNRGTFSQKSDKIYYQTGNGVAPVKISGKEFGEYTGDRKAYGKAFAKYYKDNIAGTSVVSPVLGEVKFFNSAIDETIAKNISTPENLKYIAAVPQIIATSNDVTEEQVKHPKKDVIAAWRVNGQADIDGDVRNVSVVVLEDSQHNRYYTFDARKEKPQADTAVQGGLRGAKAETTYNNNITQTDGDVNDTFYQTGVDGELNLEVTPMAERVPTAEQKRKSRMIYPVMGQYEPAKKLITLFKGHDKTTLTHELLHHYLPIYLIVVIIRS